MLICLSPWRQTKLAPTLSHTADRACELLNDAVAINKITNKKPSCRSALEFQHELRYPDYFQRFDILHSHATRKKVVCGREQFVNLSYEPCCVCAKIIQRASLGHPIAVLCFPSFSAEKKYVHNNKFSFGLSSRWDFSKCASFPIIIHSSFESFESYYFVWQNVYKHCYVKVPQYK